MAMVNMTLAGCYFKVSYLCYIKPRAVWTELWNGINWWLFVFT